MSIIDHPDRSAVAAAGIKRVAVMQPYFFPYSGYFRLMAATDVFVSYDCVELPKRGWIHRNQLPGPTGKAEWLTLPLGRVHMGSMIDEQEFMAGAPAEMGLRMRRFPSLRAEFARASALVEPDRMVGKMADYLFERLTALRQVFGFETSLIRSRDLEFDRSLRGEERMLALLQAIGATHYVNAPGGVDLYSPDKFAERNISLRFLKPHTGDHWSVLHRLMTEPAASIRDEIIAGAAA